MTQHQLSAQPGQLPDASGTAGRPSVAAQPEHGLHVSTNLDGSDDFSSPASAAYLRHRTTTRVGRASGASCSGNAGVGLCCYCLECARHGQGRCALLQLQLLPQLRTLSIAGAKWESSIWCGRAVRLQKLEIEFSRGLGLHQILASLAWDLEELHLLDCEFMAEVPRPVAFPALRRVRLLESISGLAAFGLPRSHGPPNSLYGLAMMTKRAWRTGHLSGGFCSGARCCLVSLA